MTWADNVTNFPADQMAAPAECEIGFGQSHDFWFKNENNQTLPVGVFSKTCQCTSILMWLAPTERKDMPAAADREKAVKELEAAGPPTELKEQGRGVRRAGRRGGRAAAGVEGRPARPEGAWPRNFGWARTAPARPDAS